MLLARPLLMGLLLSIVALSGCIAGEEAEAPPTVEELKEACVADGVCGSEAVVDVDTGRDLRVDLTKEDTLEAPTWKVGDVFEQHVYYGSRDTAGEHIKTMVVDDSGSCYQFGTTSQNAASYEAANDLPFLGCIDKDLSTTGFGEDWSWMYDFPLEDGKTWTGSWEFLYNWNNNNIMVNSFTRTSTFEAAVNTPKGDFPGFIIVGIDDETGAELLRYNYVPAVGWFSHFWLYDITTPEGGDIVLHMMSMGRSDGYTGPYYLNEADFVLGHFSMPFVAAFGAQSDPPAVQFNVPEGATYLRGFVVPIACGGAAEVALVTPSNKQTVYEHRDEGDPNRCQNVDPSDPQLFTVYDYNEAAEAGKYSMAGAGGPIGGFVSFMTAITEVQYELTADMLPADEADESSDA